MQSPHVLAIPYPAQGHVIPLLELMQCLARHGVKITFVNTEFNQERVAKALSRKDDIGDHIHLISIPDGLEAGDDRNEVLKLTETISQFMPGKLVELIEKINESGDKITCIIADQVVGWALEVAEKMHIRRAAFWPAAATFLGLCISIPKLLDDGIIDDNGTPRKNQMVQLSPTMPAISTAHFPWACIEGLTAQKKFYELARRNNKAAEGLDWLVCNSIYELEPAVFELFPSILPLGPLLANNRLGNSGATSGKKTQLVWNGLINRKQTLSYILHLGAPQFWTRPSSKNWPEDLNKLIGRSYGSCSQIKLKRQIMLTLKGSKTE